MLEDMEPMRPVDVAQVRSRKASAEARVQQAVLTLCAIPFVVLAIAGAPLWGWGIALVCGLVVVALTEYFFRRRSLTHPN